MKVPKVVITAAIPEAGISLLRANHIDVDLHDSPQSLQPDELIPKLHNADALISLLSDSITEHILSQAPELKIIANYAVGFNNIDLNAAQNRGIIVTNTPDVLTAATADLTWALIMSVSKRIVEADRFVRDGKFTGWQPQLFLGGDVSGKTLGIIGAGRIGRAVAQRAAGFDMKVLYFSPNRKPDWEQKTGVVFGSVDDVLKQSDYISLHCPITESTFHLLDAKRIALIKPGAYLINTARGAVVDEQAMIKALQSGQLAGAGLDVYEFEPKIPDILKEMTNVVLLPHIGSATTETRDEMARICAKNVIAVLNGNPPITPVF